MAAMLGVVLAAGTSAQPADALASGAADHASATAPGTSSGIPSASSPAPSPATSPAPPPAGLSGASRVDGLAPVVAAANSDLSALSAGTPWSATALTPAFDPAVHSYQFTTIDAGGSVLPVAAASGATVVVRVAGIVVTPDGGGNHPLTLVRGRNDVSVTVTSANASSSQVYRITVWRAAAPSSRILDVAPATGSVYGGSRVTVTVDGLVPSGCGSQVLVGGFGLGNTTVAADPVAGVSKISGTVPVAVDHQVGARDVTVYNGCSIYYGSYTQTTTAKGAFSYIDDFAIDALTVAEPVHPGSLVTVTGTSVGGASDVRYWLEDTQGRQVDLERFGAVIGSGRDIWGVPYSNDATDMFRLAGPKTLRAATCAYGSSRTQCTTVLTKTVAWQVPAPRDVSFTPRFGPVEGDEEVVLKGRYIALGTSDLRVKFGDIEGSIDDWSSTGYSSDATAFSDGLDTIWVYTPAPTVAGPVPVTVSTDYGTVVARGTYVYGARPVITAVSPASVAVAGGSVVTLIGQSFGTAGTPTVIIGGRRSPSVVRVSQARLTAVIPTGLSTGSVPVVVLSNQHGGSSAAATITVVANGAEPTITRVSPTAVRAGDTVAVTGAALGAQATTGVSIDGVWTPVLSVSGTGATTTLTVAVPASVTPGPADLVVATTTGRVQRSAALTVLPEPAITTVSPSTVASTATGSAARVTLSGVGFGTSGTVKVGAAAPVRYTSTLTGTRITGVPVPTSAAGTLPVLVTPTGATTPVRGSVRVTGPTITYLGADPHTGNYELPGPGNGYAAADVLTSPLAGGVSVRVEGSGFGTSGTLLVGAAAVATTSWSDGLITFTSPARTAGLQPVTVRPAGPLTARQAQGLRYTAAVSGRPTILTVASQSDLGHGERSDFHPVNDLLDTFVVTGTNLAGSDPTATRVVVADRDGSNPVTLVPAAVTANSLMFPAPRSFTTAGYKRVQVLTDRGEALTDSGINYLDAGVSVTPSATSGLCSPTPVPGSGSVTHQPADVTVTATTPAFGTSGTATLDGTTVTTSSWTSTQVSLSMTGLASALSDPWGPKLLVLTPDDTALPATRVPFTCRVPVTVTTTIDGSASAATIAAGTPYTPGWTGDGFVAGAPFAPASGAQGYEYVTETEHTDTGWAAAHAGLPAAAGTYRVRVALSRASYAGQRYGTPTVTDVALTITGLPVTVTPHSDHGASFTYRGPLGDGTGGTPADLHWTATSTTDPITSVVWEYRDAACTSGAWTTGRPGDVAISPSGCGGDDTTVSQWDVRVKSFRMDATGTDRSGYYLGTFPTTRIQINPKALTITGVRADRTYDATTHAAVSALDVTGAVAGDTVTIDAGDLSADFADPAPGVDKPVTLAHAVRLTGQARTNYTLTNPTPTIIGTISKGRLGIGLAATPTSVLLTASNTTTITATVADTATGSAPDGSAAVPAPLLVSRTPGVCSISGTTVIALAAGTCTIAGSVPASTNYQAARAFSDDTSTTETVTVPVLGAAQPITVVAADRTVPVGDSIDPEAQVAGLFDGDTVDSVGFDYYQGATPLGSEPTDPGTYRIVPTGGTLMATDPGMYTNPTAFDYVAGTLVITPLPATINRLTPTSGPVAGGTRITITGTRLDTVTAIRIGAATLRAPAFTVTGGGTTLTFTAPAVTAPGTVNVVLVAGTATTDDLYTYTGTPHTRPVRLELALNLKVNTRVAGAKARLTGGGLRPGSPYTLVMHSTPVTITHGTTNSSGGFSQLVTMPGRACVAGGLHQLILTGTAPNGATVRDTNWIVLDDACLTRAISDRAPTASPVDLHWFLFDRLSARLAPDDKAALQALVPALRGATRITITGYTQTQNTSPASIAANRKLAMRRATAVGAYLRTLGVTTPIVTIGKGPVDPVSRADQRLNRRVVISATYRNN